MKCTPSTHVTLNHVMSVVIVRGLVMIREKRCQPCVFFMFLTNPMKRPKPKMNISYSAVPKPPLLSKQLKTHNKPC